MKGALRGRLRHSPASFARRDGDCAGCAPTVKANLPCPHGWGVRTLMPHVSHSDRSCCVGVERFG
eukprot:2796691-Prymnesium_polylepis.1